MRHLRILTTATSYLTSVATWRHILPNLRLHHFRHATSTTTLCPHDDNRSASSTEMPRRRSQKKQPAAKLSGNGSSTSSGGVPLDTNLGKGEDPQSIGTFSSKLHHHDGGSDSEFVGQKLLDALSSAEQPGEPSSLPMPAAQTPKPKKPPQQQQQQKKKKKNKKQKRREAAMQAKIAQMRASGVGQPAELSCDDTSNTSSAEGGVVLTEHTSTGSKPRSRSDGVRTTTEAQQTHRPLPASAPAYVPPLPKSQRQPNASYRPVELGATPTTAYPGFQALLNSTQQQNLSLPRDPGYSYPHNYPVPHSSLPPTDPNQSTPSFNGYGAYNYPQYAQQSEYQQPQFPYNSVPPRGPSQSNLEPLAWNGSGFVAHQQPRQPLTYRSKHRATGKGAGNRQSRSPPFDGPVQVEVDPLMEKLMWKAPGGLTHRRLSPARAPPRPEPIEDYLRQAATAPRKMGNGHPKLIIIDLNGTVLYRPSRKNPTNFIGRAFVKNFFQYLFNNNFTVMVWSSAKPENVGAMVMKLFAEFQEVPLAAVWARDTFGLSRKQYDNKIQVYKQLTKVWADPDIQQQHPYHCEGGEWDQSNTVLIDDSVEKAAAEPFNLLQIPEFTGHEPQSVGVLKQVAGYLDELSQWDNASGFIRNTPFKIDQGWGEAVEGYWDSEPEHELKSVPATPPQNTPSQNTRSKKTSKERPHVTSAGKKSLALAMGNLNLD